MKLLVIVLCLLSERFLIHSFSSQRFYWFTNYVAFVKEKTVDYGFLKNPWYALFFIVFPIVFIVSVVYFLFHNMLFGLGGLILSLVIFFYCLGPQNVFYPLSEPGSESSHDEFLGNYFAMTNSQLFAVLFWYIIGGPIVALTYRLISLSTNVDSLNQQANQVVQILEWLPARMASLLFLLAGNFQRGFSAFVHYLFAAPKLNNDMLRQCGLQAVQVNESEELPLPVAEELVEHATIILLVFIALCTLVAWL